MIVLLIIAATIFLTYVIYQVTKDSPYFLQHFRIKYNTTKNLPNIIKNIRPYTYFTTLTIKNSLILRGHFDIIIRTKEDYDILEYNLRPILEHYGCECIWINYYG